MILTSLKLWNFRKFDSKDGTEPGLEVQFHKGINALVGENDTGKSTIVDAIKLVLQTQSGEYIRITEDDFYHNGSTAVNEFKIECIFEEFIPNEAKNFVEWLIFTKDEKTGSVQYKLKLHYRAWKEKNRIFTDLSAGNEDGGVPMDNKARELLKCTYLRPLRDAAREMNSGRNTRIAQILYNHPVFNDKEEHELVHLFKEANDRIEKYFTETGKDGKKVLDKIKGTFSEFSVSDEDKNITLHPSGTSLKSVLENLSLSAQEVQPGLGLQNLLFIAAELLLLNEDDYGGLRLALIEELEAHLHPQAQLRVMAYLQNEYNDAGVQIIITTHSTTLASKVNIKNLILCKNNRAYSLSPEKTELERGDYLFLQRFLDATKANLFFAKGIIMVEGDAENLLIPIIAKLLDLDLEKHGVSIVNVGSLAFFRYSKIFMQKDREFLGVPIAIVTDCDQKLERKGEEHLDRKEAETKAAIESKNGKFSYNDEIKAFVAPHWTFEFTLALSQLRSMLYQSVLFAGKIQNSDKYTISPQKVNEIIEDTEQQIRLWTSQDDEIRNDKTDARWKEQQRFEAAYNTYNELMLKKDISKAIVAQCLASCLQWNSCKHNIKGTDYKITQDQMFELDLYQLETDTKNRNDLKQRIENDPYLEYIVNAINHATRKLR